MIVLSIILGLFTLGIAWYFYVGLKYTYEEINKSNKGFNGILIGSIIIGTFISFMVQALIIFNTPIEPSAIDVYRGRTELEIHSINNIPQDTIVVWKGGKQ